MLDVLEVRLGLVISLLNLARIFHMPCELSCCLFETVVNAESNLTWNWGDTKPVLGLRTRATDLECFGDMPR